MSDSKVPPLHLNPINDNGDTKEIIPFFFEGESLYRRHLPPVDGTLKVEDIFTANMKLTNISVNRQGNPSYPISEPDDVLWDCVNKKWHQNHESIPLLIEKISNPSENVVKFMNENNIALHLFLSLFMINESEPLNSDNDNVIIGLNHMPDDCNFAHCLIVFYFKGKLVTSDNYNDKDSLGGAKKASILRKSCRSILAEMIRAGKFEGFSNS